MNSNSTPATTQAAPQRLPKTRSKFTFVRMLLYFGAVLCVAAVVFWYFNIRQPGVSFQRPVPNESAASETNPLQQSAQVETPATSNQTEDAQEKPSTTAAALKKHVVHLATTIGERKSANL